MDDLRGKRILVVEDEYFLADDTVQAITAAGATTLGPCASKHGALELIAGGHVDLAVLDISLADGTSFDVADALRAAGAPFVFVTGYDCESVPERHRQAPRMVKPCGGAGLVEVLARLAEIRAPA